MKQKAEYKNARYRRLKIKIFFGMAGMLLLTLAGFYLLYEKVIFGNLGEFVVDFLQSKFFLEREDATTIYRYTFRENWGLFVFIGMLVLFLIFCWLILLRIVISYFKSIDQGLSAMLAEDKKEIELPAELLFLEKKMNEAKRTMERRKLEAEIENVRKNDLITYLAHDLKTPLSSVIVYLSLLDEAPDMPPGQKAKYVGIALEKAERLETLINEFFEITRFNLQTIVLNKRKINLSYMLQQMTDEFYPILESQGKKAIIKLFITFFQIGLFGFGGGYGMLSLIQGEVVHNHGWLTTGEFTDIVAISQMTPGPIGINSATYCGYTAVHNAGYGYWMSIIGSVTATFALVLPSLILMILISRLFMKYMNTPTVQSVFSGLRPAVVGLLGAATLLLMTPENFSAPSVNPWQFWISCFLFVATMVGTWHFKINPIRMICYSGFAGLILLY